MSNDLNNKSAQSRSSRVGLLMSSASIPGSFQKSLMDRDNKDQGIVTGLTMALSYAIGALTQDSLDAVTDSLSSDNADNNEEIAFAVSAAATVTGLAIQYIFEAKKDQNLVNSTMRTGGNTLAKVGFAGVVSQTLEASSAMVSKKGDRKKAEAVYSMLVPLGALAVILADSFTQFHKTRIEDDNSDINVFKSVGIAIGVAGLLGIISYIEQSAAKTVNKTLQKYAPALNSSKVPIGNIISFGLLLGGLGYGIKKLYKKIENGADKLEDNFKRRPSTKYVSGGKNSLVSWDSLSVQGRRHIGTRLTPKKIAKVLKVDESMVIEPIRVYVGIDSAPTEFDRVELALKELERTGAFERKTLVIISPTGTGYVNYVMSDSVEYMSLGNCAQVTLQYSKRPSPLSLDLRNEGYVQYRMLVNGIHKKVSKMAKSKRPQLVLFGESLGAWTSQDAFMYEGTDGFLANGIERSLWIGTPASSKWKDFTYSNKTLNTEKDLIGIFSTFSDYEKESQSKKDKFRYFVVTNDNDPVAKFTVSLLVQKPDWLEEEKLRPSSISPNTQYRVPGTFVQTLVDMKNALKPIPGDFVSTGHDYRGSLAPFIRVAYQFSITDDQYSNVVRALKANDRTRAKII